MIKTWIKDNDEARRVVADAKAAGMKAARGKGLLQQLVSKTIVRRGRVCSPVNGIQFKCAIGTQAPPLRGKGTRLTSR